MKCCGCEKTVKLTVNVIQGKEKWYGKYVGTVIDKVICEECIKVPEKKAKYIE